MSFVWPNEPTVGAHSADFADYAELLCLRNGSCSVTKLSSDIGRLEENDYENGVPEVSELDKDIELAFQEIERRVKACGEQRYPFSMPPTGQSIHLPESIEPEHVLYCYLLLTTRLNMKTDRKHANIDGTLLFEHVSAAVANAFFGERSESMVFGTGSHEGGFKTKVNELCGRLGEGGCFQSRSVSAGKQKDGKLDVVVWKGFNDDRQGRLIGFGQCKTGRNWRDSLTQLHSESFIKIWLRDPLPVNPIRIFFVSEAIGEDEQWFNHVAQGGLLFDRCRILDYFSKNMPGNTMENVKKWFIAAAKSHKLAKVVSLLET